MSKEELIKFSRTDYSVPEYIERYIKEFADHFKTRRNYLPDFCRMLGRSRMWTIANINQQVEKWSQQFGQVSGRKAVISLVKSAFDACQVDEDIERLRGGIVEALVIAKYGGSKILDNAYYGWGALVLINENEVRYKCTELRHGDCGDRASVDFGAWNGHHGMFYECKVNPIRIGCKEIQYMKTLSTELAKSKVSHELFFVCPESQDAIKIRLSDIGIDDIHYKAMGIHQLSA